MFLLFRDPLQSLGVVMFVEMQDGTFIASPISQKAHELLKELRTKELSTRGALIVEGVPTGVFLVGLVLTVILSSDIYPSENRMWLGLFLLVADVIFATLIWWGIKGSYEESQQNRLRRYEQGGEIIRLPPEFRNRIESALRKAGVTGFVERAYVLTIEDYEAIKEAASTFDRGLAAEVEETHIAPLLDQFIGHVRIAYQNAQAEQRGRLEIHRKPPGKEIEG